MKSHDAPRTAATDHVLLVVDDEAGVRKMAARALREAGYAVVEATDGLDAWTLCMREPGGFHVLVTDVVMPRMPGTELAARVHGVRPELPVLLMTGYTPAELLPGTSKRRMASY